MTTPYSGATAPGGPPGMPEGGTQTAPTYGYQGNEAYTGIRSGTTAHSGNMGTPTTDTGRPDVEGASVGQLIGEVTKDLSTLMRQELELAKAELKVEAKKAGQGAGMLGTAGFAGYLVLLFLSLALMWGLANVMDTGWAGLVVAGIWAVIGAIAFVMGRKKFREVNPKPERTVATLQQVPPALKPN